MSKRQKNISVITFSILSMVCWVIYLRLTLPKTYSAQHWRMAWIGFDFGLFVSLIFTLVSHYRNDARAINSAIVASTFLFIDSWFDVITATKGIDRITAFILAFAIQIPLGVYLVKYSKRHRLTLQS